MNIENTTHDDHDDIFIASLDDADKAWVASFLENGPHSGKNDEAHRYLLALAMRNITAPLLAGMTGVSFDVAHTLVVWIAAGTNPSD